MRLPTWDAEDEALATATSLPVLITGAELEDIRRHAAELHRAAYGNDAPFVELSGTVLPQDQQSLRAAWMSVVSMARGGTVFLTDVEALPRHSQDALAGVLSYARNVRLITGSSSRLIQRVEDGRFSATLFYRLNAIHLVHN